MRTAKESMGVVFLELNWEDTTEFVIPEEDLVRCVKFVHEARKEDSSVLVHCAQVRNLLLFVVVVASWGGGGCNRVCPL